MTTSYTVYARAIRHESDQVEANLSQAVLDELQRLWRHVRGDVTRMVNAREAAPDIPFMIDTSIWREYEQALRKRLLAEMVKGATVLEAMHSDFIERILGKLVSIDADLLATQAAPQLGLMITNSTMTLQRIAANRVVGWYNTPGSTVGDLTSSLAPEFGVVRAKTIGRTETTRLNSAVQTQVANKLGIQEYVWYTRRDQDVCDRKLIAPDGSTVNGCMALQGRVFRITQPMPPAHVACRCEGILRLPALTKVWQGVTLGKAEFDENEHPRADNGEFASKGGNAKAQRAPQEKPKKVAVRQEKPGGRAAAGVQTIGINEAQYAGGQFLPTTEFEKIYRARQKATKTYMERKQELEPYKWSTPPAPNMHSIFSRLLGVPAERVGDKLVFHPEQLNEQQRKYLGAHIEAYSAAYNRGERWIEENNMPHLTIGSEAAEVKKAAFDESEHPRDAGGEFTSKGGGVAPKEKQAKPERIRRAVDASSLTSDPQISAVVNGYVDADAWALKRDKAGLITKLANESLGGPNEGDGDNALEKLYNAQEETRAAKKARIAFDIAKKAGTSHEAVGRMVHVWAESSNDNHVDSLAIQRNASELFGAQLSDWQNKKLKENTPTQEAIDAENPEKKAAAKEKIEQQMNDYVDAYKREWERMGGNKRLGRSQTGYFNKAAHKEIRELLADQLPDFSTPYFIHGGTTLPWGNMINEGIAQDLDDSPEYLNDLFEDARSNINDYKVNQPVFGDDFIKANLQAMYDNTQEQFTGSGLSPDDELTLFRGINIDLGNVELGDVVKYKGNAAESWSFSAETAKRFGQAVLMSKVKVRNILSTFASGFGCMNEQEVVVLGGEEGSVVVIRN